MDALKREMRFPVVIKMFVLLTLLIAWPLFSSRRIHLSLSKLATKANTSESTSK